MSSSRDEVLIRVRMQGGKAAAKDIEAAEKQITKLKKTSQDRTPESNSLLGRLGRGLRKIGPDSKFAEGAVAQFRRTTRGVAGDVSGAISTVAKLTAAITGLSVAGGIFAGGAFVASGLKLNANCQSAGTSFATLLKSASRGKKFMTELQQVSDGTALRLTEAMSGAQQLLGQGMNEPQSLVTLKALNAAIIANGKGNEQFQSGARTLGQMWANQKVSLEDINQLSDGAELNVRAILSDKLKIKPEDMADIGNMNVPSGVALQAITQAWQEDFGKAAKKANGDWNVQTKNMTKSWEKFKRVTTAGLFTTLNKKVFPQLQTALTHATDTMSRKDLTFSQKVKLTWKGLKKDLGPLASELKKGIDDLKLGKRVKDGVAKYGPDIVEALGTVAGNAAPKVASALWEGFKNMGPGGKAITAALLLRWLRFPFWGAGVGGAKLLAKGVRWGGGKALGPVGRSLGGWFGRVFRRSASSSGSPANWSLGQWAKAAQKGGRFAGLGTTLGTIVGVAMAAAALNELTRVATGKSISQRLREGMSGKDAPGSKGFDPTITPKEAKRRGVTAKQLRENRERNTGTGIYAPGGAVAEALLPKAEREALQRRRRRAARKARGRWTGGMVQPGEVTVVGGHGPELARFAAGTEIVPTHRWDAPPRRDRSGGGRRDRGVIRETRRETPINLYLNSKLLLQELSVQTEREALAH